MDGSPRCVQVTTYMASLVLLLLLLLSVMFSSSSVWVRVHLEQCCCCCWLQVAAATRELPSDCLRQWFGCCAVRVLASCAQTCDLWCCFCACCCVTAAQIVVNHHHGVGHEDPRHGS